VQKPKILFMAVFCTILCSCLPETPPEFQDRLVIGVVEEVRFASEPGAIGCQMKILVEDSVRQVFHLTKSNSYLHRCALLQVGDKVNMYKGFTYPNQDPYYYWNLPREVEPVYGETN